jgi:hypothetical protein
MCRKWQKKVVFVPRMVAGKRAESGRSDLSVTVEWWWGNLSNEKKLVSVSIEWWWGNVSKVAEVTCLWPQNGGKEMWQKGQKQLVCGRGMVVGKRVKSGRRNLSVSVEEW